MTARLLKTPPALSLVAADTANRLSANPTPLNETTLKSSSELHYAIGNLADLDRAAALDPATFPNPPSRPGYAPPATIPNVRFVLDRYGITARYNVIKKKLEVKLPGDDLRSDNGDNSALTQVLSLLTLNGIATGQAERILETLGDRNPFNPVAVWIHLRPWDGRDRLDDLYATLTERGDYPRALKETLIHKWLLSAVAAALCPVGFRTRGVLTLQGAQGLGKTQWTKSLVPEPVLRQQVVKVDHHMDAQNKDSLIAAASHWIVELGELESSLKKDIARLKGFLTADLDKVRRPYARVDSEYPRRTVFCATVNGENFLVDPTGNTRFWTIPVIGINFAHAVDMQQLFAQLALELEKGGKWWLTESEEALLEEQNREYRTVSALRERLLDRIDQARIGELGLEAATASQVLKSVGIDNPTNAHSRECGEVLRELLGEPRKNQGRYVWRVPFKSLDLESLIL